MKQDRPARTPWGCPPPSPAAPHDIAFHRGQLIFHTLTTDDPDVIRAVAGAAARGENLAEWATGRLVHGIRCARPDQQAQA